MRGSSSSVCASASARPGRPGSSTRSASGAVGCRWIGSLRHGRTVGHRRATLDSLHAWRAKPFASRPAWLSPETDPARRTPASSTLAQVAARAGVSPGRSGAGSRGAGARVRRALDARRGRVRARRRAPARARAHARADQARPATTGQLAFGPIENCSARSEGRYTLARGRARERARAGADRADRTPRWASARCRPEALSEEDLRDAALRRRGARRRACRSPAFLQLLRVYGQAMAQIADAEVRLFHLYVHEPLMRDGRAGVEIAEEMEALTRELLPLASPFIEHVHGRLLASLRRAGRDRPHGGRARRRARPRRDALRVAIAFADLAGYTRLTEEQGDEAAVGAVERFVEAVEQTLPDDARVIKTIGDEVMVVGADAAALADWAVRLAAAAIAAGRARCRGSASTTATRSTATATTTAARSTWPRAWSRAPAAARCWSRAPSSKRPTAVDGLQLRADRRGAAQGLLRADRAVHRLARGRGKARA